MPSIPEVDHGQALTDLLESIALEEAALAGLIQAEAIKIQAVAQQIQENVISADDLISVQKTVVSVMQAAINMQMLLQFKLEKVIETIEEEPYK